MRRKSRSCPTCGAFLPEKPNPAFGAPQEREVLRRLTLLEGAVRDLLGSMATEKLGAVDEDGWPLCEHGVALHLCPDGPHERPATR